MKRFKIIFFIQENDGNKVPASMNGFGKGFSLGEANTLKNHLESCDKFKGVRVVGLTFGEADHETA